MLVLLDNLFSCSVLVSVNKIIYCSNQYMWSDRLHSKEMDWIKRQELVRDEDRKQAKILKLPS